MAGELYKYPSKKTSMSVFLLLWKTIEELEFSIFVAEQKIICAFFSSFYILPYSWRKDES